MASELFTILEEVKAQILALNLTGIPDANIKICGSPSALVIDTQAVKYPLIAIGPFGAEDITAATNVRDDVRYPVLVAIADTLASYDTEQPGDRQSLELDKRLTWREQIRKAFSNQRLAQAAGMNIQIQPMAIVEPAAFQRDLWVSSLLLRISNREART